MAGKIDWDEQPLGTMSDGELAEQLGVTAGSVCRARKKRKIPSWQEQRKRRREQASKEDVKRPGRPSWGGEIDWDKQPFGTMSDGELAQRLGVHTSAVCRQRQKRRIPSRQEQRQRQRADKLAKDLEMLGLSPESPDDHRIHRPFHHPLTGQIVAVGSAYVCGVCGVLYFSRGHFRALTIPGSEALLA